MLVAVEVSVAVPVAVLVSVAVLVEVPVAVAVDVVVPVGEFVLVPDPVAVTVAVAEVDTETDLVEEAVVDFDLEDDAVVDFEIETDADDVVVADADDVAMPTPTCPPRVCQRNGYVVLSRVTEINDSKSPASANVAVVSSAALKPAAAVTTMSPPSAYIRSTKRMPAFVGAARVRVSAAPTEVISQIWRSLLTMIVPPFLGSEMTFGPRYRS